MTVEAPGSPAEAISPRLADAVRRLDALDLGDEYLPAAPDAIVGAGVHLALLPIDRGGLGGGIADAVTIQAALGAVDGSVALGFAMHQHVVGAMGESDAWPEALRSWVHERIGRDGALLNAASTEERGGSPARGAVPDTVAREVDGTYRVTGEKSWTTWLPALGLALVTARVEPADEPRIGLFVVDLESQGVERLPGFEALGMRASASGRLRLDDVAVPRERLVLVRGAREPDPRGPAPAAWFGLCIAATYLGIGEGARSNVARWALDRRPGDRSTAVSELPTVRVRLGRLDAELRTARIVLMDVVRRWDEARGDLPAQTALTPDITLAKLVATRAAVNATDEALRICGGPGFMAGKLERAFRDARAGLINPPLEDVALQDFAGRVLAASEPN